MIFKDFCLFASFSFPQTSHHKTLGFSERKSILGLRALKSQNVVFACAVPRAQEKKKRSQPTAQQVAELEMLRGD